MCKIRTLQTWALGLLLSSQLFAGDPLTRRLQLPDIKEMTKILDLWNDNPYYQERFYPTLLKQADEEKTVLGIRIMVETAILDFMQQLDPVGKLAVSCDLHQHKEKLIESLTRDTEAYQTAYDLIGN